jgi:hypothetical protein
MMNIPIKHSKAIIYRHSLHIANKKETFSCTQKTIKKTLKRSTKINLIKHYIKMSQKI